MRKVKRCWSGTFQVIHDLRERSFNQMPVKLRKKNLSRKMKKKFKLYLYKKNMNKQKNWLSKWGFGSTKYTIVKYHLVCSIDWWSTYQDQKNERKITIKCLITNFSEQLKNFEKEKINKWKNGENSNNIVGGGERIEK